MNNNSIISLLAIVLLVTVGGIGYAIWSSSNPGQVGDSQNSSVTQTTDNNNSTTVLQAGAPVVKTDTVTAPYISTVVVKGTVNPNGAITTYWYEYGQTSSLGLKTAGYSVGSGYTTIYTPAYLTGLISNTNYYFRLVSANAFGIVVGATYSFKTNTTPAPTGNAPTTKTTAQTGVSITTANLHGQVQPNGSETTFWFEYGKTSQLGLVTAFQSAGSGSSFSSVSVSVSNLQPITKYFFRLNAQNQFGTVNGEILNFTTTGPTAASAPTVTTTPASAVTDSSAKLHADVNPHGAMTTYWFEYSNNSLLSNVLVLSTPEQSLNDRNSLTGVSANINNLNNNTKYYFRAVAKNQYGTVRGDVESFTSKK